MITEVPFGAKPYYECRISDVDASGHRQTIQLTLLVSQLMLVTGTHISLSQTRNHETGRYEPPSTLKSKSGIVYPS